MIFPQNSTQFVKTLPSANRLYIHTMWITYVRIVHNLVDENT